MGDLQAVVIRDATVEFAIIPFAKAHSISKDELRERFLTGYPGWDKINDDYYHIYSEKLKLSNTLKSSYTNEVSAFSKWCEDNLMGEFCITGVFYDGTIQVVFQYQSDMILSRSY